MSAISNWKRWAGFLVLGLLTMPVAAQTSAPVRVALWATTLNADSEKYLDVAVAELTARGGVELVERQAIRRVLDEQSQALQQDSSGVAVGKLLRADVIGVLETTPDGKEAGGFAVLDTAAGVSYWNQGLESSGVEEVAREIVRGVAAALEKHGRAGSLSTVCMLGARNAEFPRNMDVFCEMVAYLLDRRLVENPAVTTLDRRRLETVISENRLPGVEDKSGALLPSLRLVELDFRRGASEEEIKVLARVTDAGGALIAQPEVTGPKDAVALVEKLQAALADVLHTTPQAARGDRAAEANRFRTQGKILWDRDLREAGMLAYDAAYVLKPGSERQVLEYVERLFRRAYDYALEAKYERAVALINRGLDAVDGNEVPYANMGTHHDHILNTLARCKNGIPVGTALRDEFERLCRRYLVVTGMTDAAGRPSANDINAGGSLLSGAGGVPVYYPEKYSQGLRFPVHAALTLSRDADEFFRLLEVRLAPWLEREADSRQRHDAGVITTLDHLAGTRMPEMWEGGTYIPYDDTYLNGLRDMAARMCAHPRAVVRLEGEFFKVWMDRREAERKGEVLSSEDIQRRAVALIEEALTVTRSAESLPPGDLEVVYEMAARAAKLIDPRFVPRAGGTPCDDELLKIAESMFAQRHLSGAVLKTLLNSQADFTTYRLPVLQKLDAACDDSGFVWLGFKRGEAEHMLRVLARDEPSRGGTAGSRLLWATDAPQSRWERWISLSLHAEDGWYAVSGRQSASIPNQGSPLTVWRMDVESGRKEPLGQIWPQTCWASQYHGARQPHGCEGNYVEGAVRVGRRLWIATSGDGLFGVPLEGGGEPLHVGMAEGLPSAVIHSVAAIGDVLYIGCGQFETEGYLAAYELAGGRCRVLASTMRASPETPLDALSGGFRIRGIVPDTPRRRLLVVVDNGDLKPATGIWECRLDDGGIRQLQQMDRVAHAVLPAGDGTIWVYPFCRNEWRPIREKGGWYGAVKWDPVGDRAWLAFATKKKGAGPGLPVQANTLIFPNLQLGGALVAEGWLYHFAEKMVDGESVKEVRRVSLASGHVETIHAGIFRGNVYQWGRLHWLPEKRILLVSDGDRLAAVKIED